MYDGLYCAQDPERNLQHGIDGADVVYENLRQICIFRTSQNRTSQAGKNSGQIKFFDYMHLFAKHCKDKMHNRSCSEVQMTKAKFTEVPHPLH